MLRESDFVMMGHIVIDVHGIAISNVRHRAGARYGVGKPADQAVDSKFQAKFAPRLR